MNKTLKNVLKIVLCVFLGIIVLVAGYVGYYTFSYKRIGDKTLIVEKGNSNSGLYTSTTYSLLSWNVGFGAYSDDYSFFMDGGKYSRAFSEQAVKDNLNGVIKTLEDTASTYGVSSEYRFVCFQEVDFESTRSYGISERNILRNAFSTYWSTYAQNYNSPYLLYPFNSPHGANKSGMLTLSKYVIDGANRVELPVESGFAKYADLDRCLSINRIPVSGGKTFVLINMHLTAYSSDGKIAKDQLKMLIDICKTETEAGNYVICAGDFNQDLYGNASEVFGVDGKDYTWAKPFDKTMLDGTGMSLVIPGENAEEKVPSCRNADAPYEKGKQFVLTVDGFLVSSNITVDSSNVQDEGFKYSDHNPVCIKFRFKNK